MNKLEKFFLEVQKENANTNEEIAGANEEGIANED